MQKTVHAPWSVPLFGYVSNRASSHVPIMVWMAAMERATEHGVGVSVARNMTHTGMMGFYSMMAAHDGGC